MVIPGFLANDRTTLGLQRALAAAGYRVIGWGMGMNKGVEPDTLERLAAQIERHGRGAAVILVGWSLGGIYSREVAKLRPDLAAKVITLGSPFWAIRAPTMPGGSTSASPDKVDAPPVETNTAEKPPVPTLAIWSRRDGIVAPASARGDPGRATSSSSSTADTWPSASAAAPTPGSSRLSAPSDASLGPPRFAASLAVSTR